MSRISRGVWLLLLWMYLFGIALWTPGVKAQTVNPEWSQPYRLSTETGQVGDQVIFADQFGYVHLFWPETSDLGQESVIQYSRFDGETWSTLVDIYYSIGFGPVVNVAATADINGTLHVLFTHSGLGGPVYYMMASIEGATSARSWQKPVQLDFSAQKMVLKADSMGTLHLLFTGLVEDNPGIYYTNSSDQGQTWSQPLTLDPDLPADLTPKVIQFEVGQEDSLHAVWHYADKITFVGRGIRYAHSFDLGQHWSTPYIIDEVEAGSEELRMADPSLAVNGDTVLIIYAGDQLTHRKERISNDSGATWSAAEFIFGDLHGQALGDGVAWDALGRLHFFGQIRYPQGIYHVYWDQGRWSIPTMIYLMARDAFDSFGDRISAHRVRSAIRAGNQVVVTFTTSPGDPRSILYVMQTTLQDVPGSPVRALPTLMPMPAPNFNANKVSPTPSRVTPTETPHLEAPSENAPPNTNTPAGALVWGIVPALMFVAGVITVSLLIKRL